MNITTMRRLTGMVLLLPACFRVCAADLDLSTLPPPATRAVDFVRDIQPVLAKNCYRCHGEQRAEADLRWDVKASAFKGSDHGTVLMPGKSAESRMIHLVAGIDPRNVMPRKGDRLSAEQVGLLRAWIDQGAIWPDAVPGGKDTKRDHWAFKAPVRPAVPRLARLAARISNPIDAFIGARLEKEGLKFSPEADRTTLIRRLSLDLTGLPPAPAEVDAFLDDKSPDAYEKVVERLVASLYYVSSWGRILFVC